MALQPGAQFGRYQLVSRLGRGGMAETWRARLLGAAGVTKPVLIKRVLSEYSTDEAFTTMFVSEARISATLSHGNIAQVYDFGRLDEEYFLAMEFVDGQPLNRILKRALRSQLASIPVPLAAFIALEMCRGLHYAHTRTDDSGKSLGIVHRDISPDNVIISYEGQVKIVDFGIAKARQLRGFDTAPGIVKGKFLFFSPEQAHGEEVDARTDVWATGVVLYEMLCGRLPVEGPQYVALPKLVRGEFPRPGVLKADLPAELNAIVMKALAVKREDRFDSCHAFGDALAGFLYSTAPRFSAMSLAHFVQELFREDLAAEGRTVQVPRSFLDQLAVWRGATPPTGPMASQVVRTDPVPPAAPTAPTVLRAPRAAAAPSRVMLLVSAGIGVIIGVVVGVALVLMQGGTVRAAREPSRPQGVAAAQPPAQDTLSPQLVPQRPERPAPTPQQEPRPPRGSAEYPVDNILIEARRDVVDVTRVAEQLPLEPGTSYRISEPNPPEDAPPLFFWLASPLMRAEDSVGAISKQPRLIKGATGLKVFGLAPLPPDMPRREVLVENLQSGDSGRLVLAPPEGAGTEQAFQLTRLDEKTTYRLEALPVAEIAYTRGEEGGPVGMVACVRLSEPGAVPDGILPGAFNREQQFLLRTDASVNLSGATGLLCGFIDSDPSDNRGAIRLRLTPLVSNNPALIEDPSPPKANSPAPKVRSAERRAEPGAVRRAHDDALLLIRTRQFDAAASLARECLQLDPQYARCHMLLGTCYARLSKLELAAKHYREFVRLAPKDPDAPRVQQLLRAYERRKAR
ncbi:MAG TPA: protein kinase [Myxococcaceae bacterium]|nr:protein kinase [Myxococcaceae bacterium]